jgi:DNA-binding GntR family transcriptional regulator
MLDNPVIQVRSQSGQSVLVGRGEGGDVAPLPAFLGAPRCLILFGGSGSVSIPGGVWQRKLKHRSDNEPNATALAASPDGEGESTAYERIVSTLADRISSGVYPPGSRVPSGAELCREFGVSPMTVRRALNILKNQGLVTSERGRGTFARSPDLGDSMFRLDSPGGEWLDRSAEIRMLSAAMTRADERVVAMLGVSLGTRVVYLRRLVLWDDSPAMYHTEYITYDPRRPLVESQLQLTSLHAFLDSRTAQRFPRGELTLTAVKLDAESAQILAESEGALALRLEHVFQGRDRTPVSWGWFLMRAELFRLRAHLGPE